MAADYKSALSDFGSAASLFGSALESGASASGYKAAASGFHAEGAAYDLAASIANKDVGLSRASTAIQMMQTQRQIYQVIGGAKADIGAAGLEEHGSAIDVIKSSAQQGALQEQVLQTQGMIQTNTYEQQSAAYTGQAKAAYANEQQALANAAGAKAGGIGKTIGGIIKVGLGIASLFCWVAREVYGENNPRWKDFRNWIAHYAPRWFFLYYMRHGEDFADFIRNKPLLKFFVRFAMDVTLNVHVTRREMCRAKHPRV